MKYSLLNLQGGVKETHVNGIDVVPVFPVLEVLYYDSEKKVIVMGPDFYRMKSKARVKDLIEFPVLDGTTFEAGLPYGRFEKRFDGEVVAIRVLSVSEKLYALWEKHTNGDNHAVFLEAPKANAVVRLYKHHLSISGVQPVSKRAIDIDLSTAQAALAELGLPLPELYRVEWHEVGNQYSSFGEWGSDADSKVPDVRYG